MKAKIGTITRKTRKGTHELEFKVDCDKVIAAIVEDSSLGLAAVESMIQDNLHRSGDAWLPLSKGVDGTAWLVDCLRPKIKVTPQDTADAEKVWTKLAPLPEERKKAYFEKTGLRPADSAETLAVSFAIERIQREAELARIAAEKAAADKARFAADFLDEPPADIPAPKK